MLSPSKHNIISELISRNDYVIVNLLSGNADILTHHEVQILKGNHQGDYPLEFIEKGYITDPEEENLTYKLKYIEFLEEREKEELQIFFVSTYACNFSCSYCYQSEYPEKGPVLKNEVTDAFFNFINQEFANRRKYITLFGGEPLLGGASYKNSIAYFLQKCKDKNIQIAIVTNGYLLNEYIDLFETGLIREIQITLDGTAEVHNLRRKLKSGEETFNRIAENVDLCLQKGIPVNLRMVVDRENIENLLPFAQFANRRGWSDHPLFKTQLGRNYELHYCQNGQSKLFDRLSLYQAIYDIIQKEPEFLRFHKPGFSVMKFLAENGKLPDALFDSCPACKSEWAMDYTGAVYSCTATVGKPGEKLGTFYPEIKLNESKIKHWQQRDVMHIEECKTCNLQLVCGGGCGSIASNQNGSILAPDCRPIDGLNALGAQAYLI